MALPAEQFEENEQLPDQTMVGESADGIRSQVAAFLRDKEFRETLEPEAIRNYEDIVNKKGHIKPDDMANLRKFYEFMKGQYEEIQGGKRRIKKHIDQAIRERIITDKDRKFYEEKMGENITTGNQNVTTEIMEQAEKDVLDSLDNRRAERKKYDDLANSPLVEKGFLMVDETKKIPIPDENKFLRMSVPERRKWLKSVEEMMSEAEMFCKNREKAETLKLTREYEILLKGAKKEKIIGDKTIREFMEWFKGQNNEVKQFAIGEFFKEMGRYRNLWKNIRKTLKGKGLSRLEGLRGHLGYAELRIEFKNEEYAQKLDEKLDKKIINGHIRNTFAKDFESKSIEEKERYLNEFDQQMERYETLRTNIEGLEDKKTRNKLLEMYNGDNGWTEISAAYNEATNQSESSYSDVVKSKRNPKALSIITSDIKKQAIIEGVDEMSNEEKETTLKRFTHIFAYKQPDASGYQKNIRKARLEQEKSFSSKQEDIKESDINEGGLPENVHRFKTVGKEEEMIEEQGQKQTEVQNPDQKNTVKNAQVIPIKSAKQRKIPKAKVKTNEDRSFTQSTYKNKTSEKKVVKMHINSRKAIQSFNSEVLLDRDRDELSVAALDRSSSRSLEFKKIEINAYIKYIREKLKNQKSEEVEKAA